MVNSQDKEYAMKKDETFQKGQLIIYRGDEAKILDVKPVLTIKLEGKNKVICGNILLKDISFK